MYRTGRTIFQVEGTPHAKALKHEYAWQVQDTAHRLVWPEHRERDSGGKGGQEMGWGLMSHSK